MPKAIFIMMVVLGTVTIVGCGAQSVISTSSEASATVTPSPEPTTTPDVKALAAQQYLAAVNESKSLITQANDAHGCLNISSLSQGHQCFSEYLVADKTVQNAVFAINFPGSMTMDVDAFLSSLSMEISDDQHEVADTTFAAFVSDNATALKDNSAAIAASSVIRHDLGLPPAS